jgi:hypothetical protein
MLSETTATGSYPRLSRDPQLARKMGIDLLGAELADGAIPPTRFRERIVGAIHA